MGKTRYDYLDILYLYLMSLGQILRAIEIQWVLTFHPSMKTSVWQQLNIYGFISCTIRQKIAHQCLRYVKYRSMVIFLSIVTQFKNNIIFFKFTLFTKLAELKFIYFNQGVIWGTMVKTAPNHVVCVKVEPVISWLVNVMSWGALCQDCRLQHA